METKFPVTAICLAAAANECYSGSLDNEIKAWDLRKQAVVYTMPGHSDTISSLELSPDSQSLLSNSHDSTVRAWDVRPFAPTDRHQRTFQGAPAGIEKNLIRATWDRTGQRIAAGSEDRSVVIWDMRTAKMLYKLSGHMGSVNAVDFSPSNDALGECYLCFTRPRHCEANSRGSRVRQLGSHVNAWRTRELTSPNRVKIHS